MKRILLTLIVMFFINACTNIVNESIMEEPTDKSETATPRVTQPIPSLTPTPADSNLVRSNVFLDSIELLTLESNPPQFTLVLKGSLPTPCNQLRVDLNLPDSENKIFVDVYSVESTDTMCAQVLEPFEENFPLGSFPAGHYTLWVNGQLITEFDA